MCGVFGIIVAENSNVKREQFESGLKALYRLSESRGKESAGLHSYLPKTGDSWTLKEEKRATALLKSSNYRDWRQGPLAAAFKEASSSPFVVLAHSRLVTNGAAALPQNNQPVRSGKVTVVHNGIVVNVDQLWEQHAGLDRQAEVDTEVIAAILDDATKAGVDPIEATRKAFREIRGAASVGWVHDDGDFVVLATNTGDIYYILDHTDRILTFASEKYILQEALAEFRNRGVEGAQIQWLRPGQILAVSISDLKGHLTEFDASKEPGFEGVKFLERASKPDRRLPAVAAPVAAKAVRLAACDYSLLKYDETYLRGLKRCANCVLPSTFPFIEFDEEGVCNYCRHYKPRYKGVDPAAAKIKFLAQIEKYRRSGGQPDVLVPFSGGRDSSFGLHLVKKEFGFTPVTFTYDWGMVTDLARRNVARMCGQLGIQNILVSADIKTKRENIRKNVVAWLKRPDLGLVPLFMAGDKHFFSIVNQLKRQTGISVDMWSGNPLENTDFKSGFCGVEPDFEKSRLDYLSSSRKVRMALHYAKNFALNPRYINSSLLDTIEAFAAYYFAPRRDFFCIFNELVWNEREVSRTLLDQYDWEIAKDTDSTWRIGDGTAPFYNYIYLTACGFTEFDTFRSNQIREGMLTRDEALESVVVENQPRPDSIRWYLETIGLDFDRTIARINSHWPTVSRV